LGLTGHPPFTKQYDDHLVVLIDGAVEVPLDAATEEEDLVDVPAEHGPGRDINATLTEELGL
jgi:hypothetical protein